MEVTEHSIRDDTEVMSGDLESSQMDETESPQQNDENNEVHDGMDDEFYVVSIVMTREQREVIQALFTHNDWDYKEVGEREQFSRHGDEDEIEIPGMIIPPVQGALECPYCLCRPCITDQSHRQLWWEDEPQVAHERNSLIRKGLYKKFWTMLFHRMAWNDPRYMAKKAAVLNQDANRRYNVWAGGRLNKRDIMPECVLKLVRGWYPNPSHMQYMGHRWG